MFKKVVTAVATVFASSVILSSAVLATTDSNLFNTNSANEQSQQKASTNDQLNKQNPGKNEKTEGNKGQANQLKSIDKRLNKIEEMVIRYQTKFGKMVEENIDDEIEKEVDRPIVEENPVSQPETPTVPENADNKDGELAPQEAVEKAEEEAEETAEDIGEEMENAVKESPGYIGKFKSLENQLLSVTNQLDSLAARGADKALLKERRDRIVAIQEKIAAATVEIGQIQEKIIDKIKKDNDIEEKEAVEEKKVDKAWDIKFSKKLDEKTLSELVIIVHDEEGNLVETTTTYKESQRTVTVTPLQSYKVGSTYTLFIGKELSSTDGESLKKSVKMKFTIN